MLQPVQAHFRQWFQVAEIETQPFGLTREPFARRETPITFLSYMQRWVACDSWLYQLGGPVYLSGYWSPVKTALDASRMIMLPLDCGCVSYCKTEPFMQIVRISNLAFLSLHRRSIFSQGWPFALRQRLQGAFRSMLVMEVSCVNLCSLQACVPRSKFYCRTVLPAEKRWLALALSRCADISFSNPAISIPRPFRSAISRVSSTGNPKVS